MGRRSSLRDWVLSEHKVTGTTGIGLDRVAIIAVAVTAPWPAAAGSS
jgi:hypothetical protein